jgi:outer membrane protein assembly factor BamB
LLAGRAGELGGAVRCGIAFLLLALFARVSALEQEWAPTLLWSQKISRGLASAPLLVGDRVWIPRPKGGVDVRSLAEGNRLFRFGGRNDMRLLDGVSDTLIFVRERSGFDVVFVTRDPPAIAGEVTLRAPILDIDSHSGTTAFMRTGSDVGLVDCSGVTRLGQIRLPGPGWCRLDVIPHPRYGVLLFLSKRDGTTVAATSGGVLCDIDDLAGGILEAFPHGEGALVFGTEGQVRYLDPELSTIWEVDLGSGLHAPPLPFFGGIWVALRDRRLVCLEAHDGSIRSVLATPSQVKSALVVAQGHVVWCDSRGKVTAVDAHGQEVAWRSELERPAVGVAAGEGRLVVATEEGRLHCFDAGSESVTPSLGTEVNPGRNLNRAGSAPGPPRSDYR